MNKEQALPAWLVLVVIIETLPMFLFPLLVLSNPAAASSLTGGESFAFAAVIYSARNLAVGTALLLALWLRHRAMLFILILVRLITDLVDYPAFLFLGEVSNVLLLSCIFVFLYYIPALLALRYLWREMPTSP